MAFEQAAIKVEKKKEFEELKSALERVFSRERIERFLEQLNRKGIRIRDFDRVLGGGVFEQVDQGVGNSGSARKVYETLALSDQAQIREFYLSKVEEVDSKLRHKFKKLYQYY